jgi:hypothetical protein
MDLISGGGQGVVVLEVGCWEEGVVDDSFFGVCLACLVLACMWCGEKGRVTIEEG